MGRGLLAIGILFVLAGPARAGGLNIAWGPSCWADNPVNVRMFACDNDTGSILMTGSFVLDRDLTSYGGFDAQIDLQSDSAQLPDWWQLSVDACREGAISGTAESGSPSSVCADASPGKTPWFITTWRSATFPSGISSPALAPNRAQLFVATGSAGFSTLHAGTEYFAFTASLDTRRTTGADACGGCAIPAAIVLNEIRVYGNITVRLNAPVSNQCLRWQASGATLCAATPAGHPTWGAIKSLYR